MDKFSKLLPDPIKLLKALIFVFAGAGLVVYMWLQATANFDSDILTETAVLVTVNDSVDARAYVFRDETVLAKDNNGTTVTVVSDGERVSKGQLLANIYPNEEDSVLQDEINRIDRRIAIIDDSSVDSRYVITDLSKIDGDIGEIFSDVYSSASKGKISDAVDASALLLVELNRRDLIVNTESDYTNEREELIKRRNAIERKINTNSSSVYASSSGYFYGETDGYEEIFTVDLVDTLTLESFKELTQSDSDLSLAASGAVKIINDYVWYTVCEIPSDKAAFLEENKSYKLTYPESGDAEITMKLIRKITETTSAEALAVFRANVMPDDFNFKRGQKAEIVLKETSGLSIPKKALRVIDGVNGVYVLIGDVIHYRSVDIIDETDNYYIVRYGKSSDAFEEEKAESPYKQISLYDNVIVSGKELFDGKIVG